MAGEPMALKGFDFVVRRSNGPRVWIRQVETPPCGGVNVVAADYSDPPARDERGRTVYGQISLDEQVRVIGLSQLFHCGGDTCSIRAQYKVVPRMQ